MELAWRYQFKSLRDATDVARWCEDHGVAQLWCGESSHDPFLPVPLLAAATTSVRLGTGIAVAFARTPFSTALTSWELQRLSGGRFVLGLGTQVKAHVERRYGQPWIDPVQQMREYVECCRAIWQTWDDDRLHAYEGRFYRFAMHNPEFTPARDPASVPVPVWLAAVGPRMIELAASVADGVHVHVFHTERSLRELYLPALRAARPAAAGPGEARPGAAGGVFPATSPLFAGVVHSAGQRAELMDYYRPYVAFYASTPAYRQVLQVEGLDGVHEELRARSRAGQWGRMPELITDEMLERFVMLDEPAALGQQIRERYDGILTQVALYRGGDRFMSDADWVTLAGAMRATAPAVTP
jgi:probable F420-dependent oxidoreductase